MTERAEIVSKDRRSVTMRIKSGTIAFCFRA
jgi:hypothetical protein